MWNETAVSQRLGIKYPILLGPFGASMSSEQLVVSVSEGGGLGVYGANAMSYRQIRELAASLRRATRRPFGINLWVPTHDQPLFDAPGFEAARERLGPYFAELNVPLPTRPDRFSEIYEAQVEAVLEARPAVFSFCYGVPAPDVFAECRRREIVTIGTATTADEAEAIEKAGADMVVATGSEAGGHRVSFLKPAEEVLTGLFALLPQVADRVKIPVIAAGGVADGRCVAAAFNLGACGVQVGTAFLACEESAVSPAYKETLFSAAGADTCLTTAFTGRLARAVRNRFTEDMRAAADEIAPYPVQGWLTAHIRAAARAQGREDLLNYWAGQNAALLRHRRAETVLNALVAQAAALIDKA